ncbi:MAG: PHP domain-containing protein [Candidatus Omnitrophica bacterium]|nr:PHP domain-containing protein [Candidatus Omnitrophota bacterium]
MTPGRFRRMLLAGSCALLAGCSILSGPVFPMARSQSGHSSASSAAAPNGDYHDVVGVIHIHTNYSHDAHGTFEDVVRVANAERLDYVIVTEHNTLKPLRDGWQGWHGATLVLIGMEISTRGGHYLALNVKEDIDRAKLTTQQIIDEVNRQGGLGFIAHPYFKGGRWKDWDVTGFTGIEAYNVAHDTLDENRMRLVLWTLAAPAEPFYFSILDRPYDPLAKWDELIQRFGRVVGIGSSDAHEFHLLGLKFAPYQVMFQLIRTHLLVPPGRLTDQAIYDALRQGHAYLAIELLAEAKGFSLLAETDRRVLGVMGDDVTLEPGLRLSVSSPAPAELALFRDGKPIAQLTGQTWQIPVTEPGAYRLEASRHGKPWIFSNPIYIHPALSAPSQGDTPSAPKPGGDVAQ